MSVLSPVTMEKTPRVPARWHAYADIFPWMEGADRAALVEDVSRNGIIEPIVFLDGAVLDGRNRYTVARELGIEYPRCDYLGDDPLGFVISRNLARRHLSESQRAMVAGTLAKMTRADAGRIGGKNDEAKPNLALLPDDPKPISTDQAAEMLNVSRASVTAAKKVIRDGVPKLAEAVKAGRVSVSAAAVIAEQPKSEQEDIAALDDAELKSKVSALRDAKKRHDDKIASLPSKVEALEISKRDGGWVRANDGEMHIYVPPEQTRQYDVWLEATPAIFALAEPKYPAEMIAAAADDYWRPRFAAQIDAAIAYLTEIKSRLEAINATPKNAA